MAMLAIIIHFRQCQGVKTPLVVLTVDHGLRKEAADEAATVQTYCRQRSVAHETLTWDGLLPKSAIAEVARDIRRDLLLQACKASDVQQLILAHTQDDVAETLLMRVRRGGLRGHASIPAKTRISDVQVIRPFLGVRREALREAMRLESVDWVDDPTNEDRRQERPRIRQVLQSLKQTEYTIEKIASYAHIMGRWRGVIADQISKILEEACEIIGCDMHIQAAVFECYPKTVAVETLRELIRFIGGDEHMINRDQASLALEKILPGGNVPKRFSAGRCVFSPHKNGTWVLSRAIRALPTQQLSKGGSIRWDGRFAIRFLKGFDEIATISPYNNVPKAVPDTAQCEIVFRPRVMDGPVSCLDEPIFGSFSTLLTQSSHPKGRL